MRVVTRSAGVFLPALAALPCHAPIANADSLASGIGERPVQPAAWPADRHEFPVAWHPSGRYLMATVEEPNHPGSSVSATPGWRLQQLLAGDAGRTEHLAM
jgi:hypothetical protein